MLDKKVSRKRLGDHLALDSFRDAAMLCSKNVGGKRNGAVCGLNCSDRGDRKGALHSLHCSDQGGKKGAVHGLPCSDCSERKNAGYGLQRSVPFGYLVLSYMILGISSTEISHKTELKTGVRKSALCCKHGALCISP